MKLYQKVMIVAFTAILLLSVGLSASSLKRQYDEKITLISDSAVNEHKKTVRYIISFLNQMQSKHPTKWIPDSEISEFLMRTSGIAETEDISDLPYASVSNETVTICSPIVFQNKTYSLTTIYNAENVAADAKSELIKSILICIVVSAVISLILSFITYSCFFPLKKIEKTSREIAAGKYASRITPVSGNFGDIFSAFNDMAESVENNVGRLSDIAKSRKNFVDSMAHEMKTPLTSILCMGDLLKLKRDVSEKDRRDYASVIVEEAKRMKELSAKLLDMASTDSASLTMEPCSVADIIGELTAAIQPICQKADITLYSQGIDGIISADKELLKSLLGNLVDNAIKASSPGQAIGIRYAPERNMMKIIVADHGIGMKPEDVKHAAEPFYMADKARSRKAGGAGLGLSLCAAIAQKHNATLDIKSELGKGTAVIVSIPFFDGGKTR